MSIRLSVLKTLLLSLVIELRLFFVVQQGREAPNMSCELFCRHFLRSSGGWSGGGSCRLRNCGFSFFFGTIPTKVSRLSASEAQTLLHQLSSLLIR